MFVSVTLFAQATAPLYTFIVQPCEKARCGKKWCRNLWVNEWCGVKTIEANKGWNEGDVVFNHAPRISECPVKQICLT